MTTSIFTTLIEPFCELFYKYKKATDLQQANINTIRNYGFSTSYALNFGFEIYNPFDLTNIQIQPGVFTYQSSFSVSPSNLLTATVINSSNQIYLSDLPSVGIGTVTYENFTLPIQVSISQNGSSIQGISSSFATNGIPYFSNSKIDVQIIRQFESAFANDETLTSLIFVYLENVTFYGTSHNWSMKPTGLYTYKISTFRYNNGYGQFGSYTANNSFVRTNISTSSVDYGNLYACTYMNVYNWANNLVWEPDFITWYSINKNLVLPFTQEFLADYFDIT